MPRAVGTQYSADDLLQMSDNVLAMQVILSGVLNKELEALKALKADIKIKQGITDTVEKANRLKGEAENYASQVKSEADSLMSKSLDAQKIAKDRLDQAVSKENFISTDLTAREKQLQQNLQGLKDRETALQIKSDQMNQSMLARENLLREEQTKLSAERDTFQNERSAYQAKVQALMTP